MTEKNRHKGKQLGLYVSDEVAEKLKSLSAQTDIPQSGLLRQALALLFEKYAKVLGQKPAKVRKKSSQAAKPE
jgi:hypothetical protein